MSIGRDLACIFNGILFFYRFAYLCLQFLKGNRLNCNKERDRKMVKTKEMLRDNGYLTLGKRLTFSLYLLTTECKEDIDFMASYNLA